MFEALGNHTKRKGLDLGDGLIPVGAITHDAGQVGHFGNPATIGFTFQLDRKNHGRTVASGLAASQATGADAPVVLVQVTDQNNSVSGVSHLGVLSAARSSCPPPHVDTLR